MAIIRVHKSKNYTCISNHILRNKEASLKAKGLLTWMISCDDDWDFSIEGMTQVLKEQESSITSGLNELKALGYLKVTKLMPESYTDNTGKKVVVRSRVEYVYDIQDEPFQDIENQDIEFQGVEFQDIENQVQRNTNIKEIKNEEIIKEETPALPVPPKNHQRLYNEERKTLSDDLESGKEIDNQKKERKRLSVEEKCLAEIDKRDFSVEVKEALAEYFNWNYHSSNPKKVKQLSDWRQKLDRLEQLIKKGEDGQKVVQQSIDNQWYGFFEYKENVKTEKHENFTENIDDWTQEEAQAEFDRKKQLVAEGKLKEY